MTKYNIKDALYTISDVGITVGSMLAGFGLVTLIKKGKFGLEELIGGVLITGSSIYYRNKCRT